MLGIAADFSAIFAGGIIGSCAKEKIGGRCTSIYPVCGIIVMILSVIGFISNTVTVSGSSLESPHLMLIIACLFLGTLAGEFFDIDKKLYSLKFLSRAEENSKDAQAFITGTVLFAVGGLQIIGPISSFIKNDNTALFLKGVIDFPFALSLGAALGYKLSFSSFAVAFMQLATGAAAYAASGFFSDELIMQLCSVGYLILFFTGFNFLFEKIICIKTVNMLPSVLLLIIYNLIVYTVRLI